MGRSRKPLNVLQCSEVSIYRSTNHVFMKLINSVQSSEVLHDLHAALVNLWAMHSVSLSSAMNSSEQNMIDVFCSSNWWSLALHLVLCEVTSVEINWKTRAGFHSGSTMHVCRCMLVYACLHAVQNEAFMETWRQPLAWVFLSWIQFL